MQGYFVQTSNPRAKHGPFKSMKKARAFAQRLADKIGKSVKIIIGGGGHTGAHRVKRKNSSAKSRIPGFDAWDTWGGGTGAPDGVYSYSITAPSGKKYSVSPHSTDGTKRRLRYILTVTPGAVGLHGWIALDGTESSYGHGASPRTLRDALKAIRAHDAKSHHEVSRTNPTMKSKFGNLVVHALKAKFKKYATYSVTISRHAERPVPGWEVTLIARIDITPKSSEPPFGIYVQMNQAHGETSGSMSFDGGGVVPLRSFSGTESGPSAIANWVTALVSEAEPLLQVRIGSPRSNGRRNPDGKYYVAQAPRGFLELRQTRFRGHAKEHPHDVMAVARDVDEMRSMCILIGPDAVAAVDAFASAKSNPIYGPGRKGGSFSLKTIKGLNKEAGLHWFEKGAMRFFGTKVLPTVYDGPGGVFFVASNKMPDSDMPRFWYVAQFNPETARVQSLDTTQAMDHVQTKAQAVAKAKLYAQGTGGMVNNPGAKKPEMVFYVAGNKEVGHADRRGRPSYKWVQGYALQDHPSAMLFTRKEAQAMAKAEGARAVFVQGKHRSNPSYPTNDDNSPQFDTDQESLFDEVMLTAENDGRFYEARDYAGAVDQAIRETLRNKTDQIREDLRVVRDHAVKELKRRWGPKSKKNPAYAHLSGRSNPVLAVTNPVTPTVDGFLLILTGALTQYDVKQQRKGQGSPYALGHYMGAVQKIKADMAGRLFSSDPADLRKLKTSMNFHLISDFSPVRSTTKKIDDYIATGKLPKYPIDRDRPRENPYRIVGSRIPADIARREDLTQAQAIRFSHDWQPGADDFGNQIQYSPDGRPPWTANADLDAIARSDTPESTAKWLGTKLQRNPRKRLPLGSHNHFVDRVVNAEGKAHLDVFEVISPSGKMLVGYYNMQNGYGPRSGLSGEQAAMVEASRLGGYNRIDNATAKRVWPFGEHRVFPVEVGPDNRGASVRLPTKQNPHTGAFRKGGVWPLTPSTHFKGETSLGCPRCGSKDITMRAVYGPGGRLGDPGGGERIDCGTCGFSQYEPERDRPPALGSVEWYQAQGSKKNPTTGQVSAKKYKCLYCGHERLESTNHYGNIYSACPACAWKRPVAYNAHESECIEPLPAGMTKPEGWKQTTVGALTKGSKKNSAKPKGTRKAGAYASFVKSQMPRFKHLAPKARMSAIAAEWRSKKSMN